MEYTTYKGKTKEFIEKWEGINFNDWYYTRTTPDFEEFEKGFKELMELLVKDLGKVTEWSFQWNYFYASGFLEIKWNYVYVCISDVRFFPDEWGTHLLYRTAENDKDFKWGSNIYSSLIDLKKNIKKLLKIK